MAAHGKEPTYQSRRCGFDPWVGKNLGREEPLGKEMTTHSSILAWEIPWTEEPGGPQSTHGVPKDSDTI